MTERILTWRSFATGVIVILGLTAAAFAAPQATYLTPLDPYPGDRHIRYADQLSKRIQYPYHAFVQMRVQPAFEGEFSVSVHGTDDDVHFEDAKQVFVSHYVADRNIWASMPEDNDGKQQEIFVAVATVDFPKPLAKRVYDAWHRILLRTRYAEEFALRVDPTVIEFSCMPARGFVYAQAYYPPECKDAALLTDLGTALIEYCHVAAEKARHCSEDH